MMPMRVQELGTQIADKQVEVADKTAAVRDLQFQLGERAAIVLAGVDYAALGKNEKERELKLDEKLRADEGWLHLHQECHAAKQALIKAEGELKALYAQRQGEEWYLWAMASGAPVDEAASSDPLVRSKEKKVLMMAPRSRAIRNFGEGPYDDGDDFSPDKIPF